MAANPSAMLVHLRWSVADAEAAPLNEEMLTRLRSYLPRYAETLSARCLGVGGIHDHLHLLLDLPVTKSLQEVEEELRRASQRFLRDVLGSSLFLWSGGESIYHSVSPAEQEAVSAYIRTQADHHAAGDLWDVLEGVSDRPDRQVQDNAQQMPETLPEWLRSAMSSPK